MNADDIRKHWNVVGKYPPEMMSDFALIEIAAQLDEMNERHRTWPTQARLVPILNADSSLRGKEYVASHRRVALLCAIPFVLLGGFTCWLGYRYDVQKATIAHDAVTIKQLSLLVQVTSGMNCKPAVGGPEGIDLICDGDDLTVPPEAKPESFSPASPIVNQ